LFLHLYINNIKNDWLWISTN